MHQLQVESGQLHSKCVRVSGRVKMAEVPPCISIILQCSSSINVCRNRQQIQLPIKALGVWTLKQTTCFLTADQKRPPRDKQMCCQIMPQQQGLGSSLYPTQWNARKWTRNVFDVLQTAVNIVTSQHENDTVSLISSTTTAVNDYDLLYLQQHSMAPSVYRWNNKLSLEEIWRN